MAKKTLFLRKAADERFPNLTAERVFVDENPSTHEQGTDRAGRSVNRAMMDHRSGMEATDGHELGKLRFAQRVAEAMEQPVRERNNRALIIAAPPRTLADLRREFPPDCRNTSSLRSKKPSPSYRIPSRVFHRSEVT